MGDGAASNESNPSLQGGFIPAASSAGDGAVRRERAARTVGGGGGQGGSAHPGEGGRHGDEEQRGDRHGVRHGVWVGREGRTEEESRPGDLKK